MHSVSGHDSTKMQFNMLENIISLQALQSITENEAKERNENLTVII